MKNRYHTLIIGSGCAGYATAERLHSLGVTDIAVITEGINMGTSRNTGSDKQTYYKLSLCGSEGDSVREMAQTLYSGGGVMGEHALCEAAYSTRCFMHLVELGVPFPTNDFGEYVGYKTDHDPRSRATSCGPLTSKYMTAALEAAVISKNIEIIDNQRVIKIITESGCVTGIACVNTQSGEISVIACRCCVLATGGPACVYKQVVYPESQHGATSLAIDAWAPLSNMEEWQYGIASTRFRWNLSGSYQQVLPRYVSVSPDGEEKELLFEALGERSLELTFLKGYEWPFDSRKLEGSSAVDLLVFEEIKKGNRVFLDYTRNPRGLENGLSALPDYLYDYLKNSDALGDTPIKRLEKMNPDAIALYASNGIDLRRELLEIAVCAQHCNGGVAVNENWQSGIKGLYAVGEAAGTFGVYRPGGSALNSTQVGALRSAENIARQGFTDASSLPVYEAPRLKYGVSNIGQIRDKYQRRMSEVASFLRDLAGMKELFSELDLLCESFFDIAVAGSPRENAELFRLYDMIITQRSVLSAMICSGESIGSHGSATVDGAPCTSTAPRSTRTLTLGKTSRICDISPMPSPELWFERVFNNK